MIPSALHTCTDTSKAKGHIVTTVVPTVFVLSKNLTLPDNRKRELCTYIWCIPVADRYYVIRPPSKHIEFTPVVRLDTSVFKHIAQS